MTNVLTNLAADIYKAADIVGRSAVGLIPAVTINAGSEAAAQGDTVRAHFTRAPVVNTSATPSMTIPEGDSQTVDNKTMTISQIASVRIPWTGEDIKHVNNGSGYETIYGDQIAQAMNGIVNAIESYLATTIYRGASRAFGTAGTTPFASNFDPIAEVRQILFDNGMPVNDGRLSLVLNSLAGTNLRQLAQLQKVNESGDSTMLRRGTLLDLQGFMLKESAQIVTHTAGTGTGTLVNGARAIGETTVNYDTMTPGASGIRAGDIVTFAADTVNRYVVNTGATTAAGNILIGGPGLRVAIPDNNAISIGATYTANLALHQSAVELVMRPLAKPIGGDAAVDMMTVQDPVSGLVFQLSVYKGYNKAMIDVTCLYDARVWKSEAVAILLG
jgi:hypothetical protein